MKTISNYIFLSIILLFVSCKQEEVSKPKVTYDTIAKVKTQEPKVNSIVLADLPIQLTGTNVLLHPIGKFAVSDGLKSKSDSYSDGENFRVSNYSEFEISGNMSNVKFQQVGQDSLIALTNKNISIERISYLKTIADKSKKQLLVYVLEDMDSNKDGKVDVNDIKDLYISEINGNNFTKLSPDFQELIDWNVIDSQNKLYFRTIEDINKNGAFDKDDKIHYHQLNLTDTEFKTSEYNPVD
jgi:hypothetical protein